MATQHKSLGVIPQTPPKMAKIWENQDNKGPKPHTHISEAIVVVVSFPYFSSSMVSCILILLLVCLHLVLVVYHDLIRHHCGHVFTYFLSSWFELLVVRFCSYSFCPSPFVPFVLFIWVDSLDPFGEKVACTIWSENFITNFVRKTYRLVSVAVGFRN